MRPPAHNHCAHRAANGYRKSPRGLHHALGSHIETNSYTKRREGRGREKSADAARTLGYLECLERLRSSVERVPRVEEGAELRVVVAEHRCEEAVVVTLVPRNVDLQGKRFNERRR